MASSARGINKLTAATNKFTPDEILKDDSGNLVFSPLSSEAVLTLLHGGTEGDSAEELAQGIRHSGSKEEIQNATKRLFNSLQADKDIDFGLTNGVFVQENFVLKEPFLKVAKDCFSAEPQHVDFGKGQETADKINRFVEEQTSSLIKELISPDSLSADTCAILVNVLRFKGNWSIPTSPVEEKEGFFNIPSRHTEITPLPRYRPPVRKWEPLHTKYKFVGLPFRSNKATMAISLRTKDLSLTQLEDFIAKMATGEVGFDEQYLPVAWTAFKYESETDYKKILTRLGVSKIFDSSHADLSGIAGEKGDTVVSHVVQKAYFHLNKDGVEGAAATYVGVSRSAVPTDESKNFALDLPYIFLFKFHENTIFAGRNIMPESN